MNNKNSTRRNFLKLAGGVAVINVASHYTVSASNILSQTEIHPTGTLQLSEVRNDMLAYCESLRDLHGPYGCYRSELLGRPDLYSSLDIALMMGIIRVNLKESLTKQQMGQWVNHINSFANNDFGNATDGSYFDTFGHSTLHANGMVIGALNMLGGKQRFPVKLYDDFNTEAKIITWLESLNWSRQWQASHKFWGGMVCFSFINACPAGWLDKVFDWLDTNADPETGWWRKGTQYADRHQPLGGSVHIFPLYEHHNRKLPFPEKVIDSVLSLQLENGRWLQTNNINIMHYLELDALYAFHLSKKMVPGYREKDIAASVDKYSKAVLDYYREHKRELYKLHPHWVLAAVGTFGLLQRLNPVVFSDNRQWTDIFSDLQLHLTKNVEVL